jgi:hypothetical protein
VIEKILYHELLDYSFVKLFYFFNNRESGQLGDLPSEELPWRSQIPVKTVDARQADTEVIPSDPELASNCQLYE